jgi:hypothetical protein
MNSIALVFGLIACVSIFINVMLAITVAGAIKKNRDATAGYLRKKLTGIEIEELRRLVMTTGLADISESNVLDLIYVIRAIQLGDYEDKEPYVPDNPYDGIGEEIDAESLYVTNVQR